MQFYNHKLCRTVVRVQKSSQDLLDKETSRLKDENIQCPVSGSKVNERYLDYAREVIKVRSSCIQLTSSYCLNVHIYGNEIVPFS